MIIAGLKFLLSVEELSRVIRDRREEIIAAMWAMLPRQREINRR